MRTFISRLLPSTPITPTETRFRLAKKKEIVALSKCDALTPAEIAERLAALQKAARKKPLIVSAVSGQGVPEALYALSREIARRGDPEASGEDGVREKRPWRP